MFTSIKRIAIAALLLLSASTAHAANRCAPSALPGAGCTTTHASLQAALDAAVAGDTVYLHAGTLYTGQLILRNKGTLSSYITITSDTAASNMPAANVRLIGATYASFMPKIQSAGFGDSTVVTEAGANHYKFKWVDFPNVPQGFNNIILLGDNSTSQQFESQEPFSFIIDQCYFHGDAVAGQKIAIQPDAKDVTITNSDFRQIAAVGQDAQCIAASNGHGPIDIENNYLECSTENVMFGGSDPWMRTFMHASGTPTTTSASVSTYETGHTLAELKIGQHIVIQTSASGSPLTVEFADITSITGTGASGTITWSPATSVVPAVPGDIRAGTVVKGVTVKRNYFTKNTAWMAGVLAAPTGVSAVASTSSGSLPAGMYCYQVQGYSTQGYVGTTVHSAASTESCATLSATGHITVTYTATPNATTHRVWRGSSGGTENQWADSSSTTFVDDGAASYTSSTVPAATFWQVKNLIEMKAAQDVVIDGNMFVNAWVGSDIGFTVAWLKSVNQDGTAWHVQSKNITFTHNLALHTFGTILVNAIEGYNGGAKPAPLTGLTIKDNLFLDAHNATMAQGTSQYAFEFNNVVNLVVDHNTVDTNGSKGLFALVANNPSPIITNNMFRKGAFGIHGDGLGEGNSSLTAMMSSATFSKNDISDASSSLYPTGNFFDASAAWQGNFVSYQADGSGDYHIAVASAMHNAGLDAKDVGADVTAVLAAVAGVDTGSASNLTITTATIPTGVRTVSYSSTLSATGGTTPYTWTVSSGTLPTGLSLSSGGVLSGTPTSTSVFTFTLQVTDNASHTATQQYTVQILDPVTIQTTSPLTTAVIDTTYSNTIAFIGGQTPFTCSVTSGSLPTGLSLGSSTCAITGTPTASGTSSFTLQVAGSLGSSASLSASLTVSAEVLPSGRPVAVGPLRQEAKVFRRTSAPTSSDGAVKGDIWIDTSTNPPAIRIALSSTPSWSLVTLFGDGSLLTNLNASQLLLGTVPNTAFPSALSIPTSVTSGAFIGSTASLNQYAELIENACSSVSTAGHARLCMDSSDHVLKVSQNGGPYALSSSASSLVGPLNSTDVVFTEENNDPYGMGDDTTKTTGIAIRALQGARRQILRTHDANSDTAFVWGFGVSSDSGATWRFPFRVRQDSELHLKSMVLESEATFTCNAAVRGRFRYTAGATGVKDNVEVCTKDASDVYAWRVIY
jgi:hypothetical protein